VTHLLNLPCRAPAGRARDGRRGRRACCPAHHSRPPHRRHAPHYAAGRRWRL